jgi:hypothetical protein
MSNEPKILIQVHIPVQAGNLTVDIKTAKPVFILGRNGTGKSALVNRLSSQLGEHVIYLPGSRPSYFDNESLSLTPATRRNLQANLKGWDTSPDTRWRSISGTQRNEKAVHDLQAAETQFKIDAANEIKVHGIAAPAIRRLQSDASPLDRVNSLLAQSNLPVQLIISDGELRAQQSGAVYSYARMSDGERSALIFASEVIAAPAGTIFLIDEPELHLHPSIVVPLLASFIFERPDCAFVICTHELALPVACAGEILLVRGGQWNGSSIANWELDLIDNAENIPESIKIDLIGARRRILFIEGGDESLDQPLYSLLFPKISLRSKESCKEVMRAVDGLRSTESLHRSRAFGLIDHDGMDKLQKAEFEKRGIYPLPIFAVESLYYNADVLNIIALRQEDLLGVSASALVEEARKNAFKALDSSSIEFLASRIAERQLRDKIMREIPSREQIADQRISRIEISFESPYMKEFSLLTEMVEHKKLEEIIMRYPVRETGVLTNLARSLRFSGRKDYERAVLQAVKTDSHLRELLKNKLGNLATHLDGQP